MLDEDSAEYTRNWICQEDPRSAAHPRTKTRDFCQLPRIRGDVVGPRVNFRRVAPSRPL